MTDESTANTPGFLPPWVIDTPDKAEWWEIDGIGAAEWAMAKLAQARRALDEIRAFGDTARQRIDQWEANASEPLAHTVKWFEGHLREWAKAERERTGNATVHLPSGRVSTRRPADGNEWRIVITDKTVLLADSAEMSRDGVTLRDVITRLQLLPISDIRTVDGLKIDATVDKETGEVTRWAAWHGVPVQGLGVERVETTATVTPFTDLPELPGVLS